MILASSSATGPTYREAQQLRRRLLAAGVDRWLVQSTANIDLPALWRRTAGAHQLTLVPDVEPEDLCPSMRFQPEGPRRDVDALEETWDEALSTRYAKLRMAGRFAEPHIDPLLATLRTPWDEGDDAA